MERGIPFPGSAWRRLVFGPDPRLTLVRVLVWCLITFVFFHHLLLPIKIIGSSMLPTYRDGSVNFINKVAYARTGPKRGEVVALRWEDELLLKRIVGLPGEKVQIIDGTIRINNRPLRDPFAQSKVFTESTTVKLRRDEYFVIGDNRESSFFAKVHKSEIVGRIVF